MANNAPLKTQTVIKTPGEFEWCTIAGEGKEDLQGNMKYSVTLVLDGDDAEKLKKHIDDFWAANRPKAIKEPKSTGYYAHTVKTDEIDPETDKPVYEKTGKTMFVFRTATKFPDGKPKIIGVYNSKGNKVSLGDKSPGNGSKGHVSGAMGLYQLKGPKGNVMDAGVTLYLNAIQVTHYVEYSQDEGFGEVDGGFEGLDEQEFGDASDDHTEAKPRL